MALPTATLVDGAKDWGGLAPMMRRVEAGWEARRHYMINTRDLDEAWTAPNLPQINEPWSSAKRELVVRNIEMGIIGGEPNGATDVRGYCFADVEYSTFGLNNSLPPATIGLKFSQFQPSQTTVTRKTDARKNAPSGWTFAPIPVQILAEGFIDGVNVAIRNGSGVSVGAGEVALIVSEYIDPDDWDQSQIARMNDLMFDQVVNHDTVNAPPLPGFQTQWRFEPGQLKYIAWAMVFDRGVVRLDQQMFMSRNHLTFWGVEDRDGKPIDGRPNYFNVLSRSENFAGLW